MLGTTRVIKGHGFEGGEVAGSRFRRWFLRVFQVCMKNTKEVSTEMKRILLSCAFLGVLALNASALHVIDNFSDGDFDSGILFSGVYTKSQPGLNDVIGPNNPPKGDPPGQRDTRFQFSKWTFPPIPNFAQVTVGGDLLACSLGTGINGTLTLSYGSYTNSGTGTQLDADESAELGVGFTVVFSDIKNQFRITLKSESTEYFYPSKTTFAGIPGGGGSTIFKIDYSQFKDTANNPGIPLSALQDIDGIQFNFTGLPSPDGDAWDLTLDLISFNVPDGVIPEPATMSLLALGGLALLRRRRRKS
jgi:hypothetical protein